MTSATVTANPTRSAACSGQHPQQEAWTVKELTSRKIMIVDDEPLNIAVVRRYLETSGYQRFVTTTESVTAWDLICREKPDLLLLDIVMPEVNGLEILNQLRNESETRYIPVLILTASTDPETKFRALDLGATDFLAKPVDPADLAPRVRNALIVKSHQDRLENYAEELEYQVRLRTAELAASRQDVIHCLARAGEYRDQETGNHVLRVGMFAGTIARELGIPNRQVELIEQAALLHDVGKIGVSDLILLKPSQLTEEEFAEMKRHCGYGRSIILPEADIRWKHFGSYARCPTDSVQIGHSPLMEMAARIAHTHHEHWDGNGYPEGLAGEEIPIEGRITSVADVYDALSSERPYKRALPPDSCFQLMSAKRGTQFDPRVLDAFLACRDEILQIQKDFSD